MAQGVQGAVVQRTEEDGECPVSGLERVHVMGRGGTISCCFMLTVYCTGGQAAERLGS